MWTEKRENGKVRYKERYQHPVTGLWKTVSVTRPSGSRVDRKIAQSLLDEKIRKARSAPAEPRKLTLEVLVRQYVESKKQVYKLQTAVGAERHLSRVIALLDPKAAVERLTAPYVRSRLWDGRATTYNERLKHFKAMMRWAFREDLVADVSWLEKLPPAKHETVRQRVADRYLEREELALLLASMRVEKWKDLSIFLVLSGLRVGEAQALTVRDVNLEAREITVNKTFSSLINAVSTTKTEASDRVVFIQDELLDVCKKIIGRRKTGILFPGVRTPYFSHYAYAKYVRENSEAVLGRRITPHFFRHTHVSLLAAAGIPLERIAERVGHESSDITRQIYLHVTEELREQAREQLKKVELIPSSGRILGANGGIKRDTVVTFPEKRQA